MDNDENEIEIINLVPSVTRDIAWDMLPHDLVPDTIKSLGLVLGDQDVLEMEHDESHVRGEQLNTYMPLVQTLAHLASGVYGEAYTQPCDKHEIDEDVKRRFNEQNYEIITLGSFAIISQLVKMGILTVSTDVHVVTIGDDDGE